MLVKGSLVFQTRFLRLDATPRVELLHDRPQGRGMSDPMASPENANRSCHQSRSYMREFAYIYVYHHIVASL